MNTLESNSLAAMQFELNWQSAESRHCELFYAPNVNMWRDIFPAELENTLPGACENDSFSVTFKPGLAVPEYSHRKVLELATDQFRSIYIAGQKISPQLGRFYPSGLLRNVPGVFPQTLAPFRIIGHDQDMIRVDLNHPLSLHELTLNLQIHSIHPPSTERGGRCNDWLEMVTHNGPGMQARFNGQQTLFESKDCYRRQDEDNDSRFYSAPRLIGHIDSKASSFLKTIYAKFLNENDKVLDLMSSVQSHLPEDYNLKTVGLGLNGSELKKNPVLKSYLVHDLNSYPALPFEDNSFDAVVCSLSIEYLTRPREIVSEVSRVLVPGGMVLISFSNRWFPPKVTRLWLEMHDFERMGLVLDYLLENGRFSELSTFSARNWPRPEDDRHAAEVATSDPIFIVAGRKNLL